MTGKQNWIECEYLTSYSMNEHYCSNPARIKTDLALYRCQLGQCDLMGRIVKE